ncbi:cytidylyl-2-hydroxypropylphosphonate hydrolase [Streptomyces sp. NPDC002853]
MTDLTTPPTTSSETARWAPGSHVLWRYKENAGNGIHICRPVTVVRDTEELLAVWLAPGTECVKPVMADGTSVHQEPLATRYTKPRALLRDRWFGTGVLKLARPAEPWSVWLFWDPGWQFRSWYVNLEEPRTRWAGGIDSEDHFLDISVRPDRTVQWHDEDEFAQARSAGLMGAEKAREVRAAGHAAIDVIRSWGQPFSDNWPDWRPDPDWAIPPLPDDWDRTPAHVTS